MRLEPPNDGNVRKFLGDDVDGWSADVAFFRQGTHHVCVKHGVGLDGALALDAQDLGHVNQVPSFVYCLATVDS